MSSTLSSISARRAPSSYLVPLARSRETAGLLTLKEYLTRLGASSTDPVIQNAIKTGTVPGMFLAFQVLTTIIFFSALLSILYYLGIMQKVVIFFAKIMQYTMKVSGAEALSNSANIFVGQTEAPLVIKPYIEKMTRSELNAIMVGGFANTAGGVLGAYILMLSGYFPNIAAHLISASILSAPAAFIVAKIMVPEREKPATLGDAAMDVPTEDVNLLDAAANGSTVGLQLTLNVIGMLFSFVAIIAMVNVMVGWLGSFFSSNEGLVQLDLVLFAMAAGVLAAAGLGKISDFFLWISVFVVLAVYGLTSLLVPDAARIVGLMGMALWLPILVAAIRKTHSRQGIGIWDWHCRWRCPTFPLWSLVPLVRKHTFPCSLFSDGCTGQLHS